MKKISAVVSALAITLTLSGIRTFADENSRIGIVLAEADTHTVIYDSNPHEKHPCGSLCKLMTVLLAEEAVRGGLISPNDPLTASEKANSMQGAQIWLMPGDKMSLGDLLKAVIIGNANDAAVVIAEAVSGSEEKFTDMMNSRAAELGMCDTCYVNSSGYLADGSFTSAYDTMLLMSALSQYDDLTEIFTARLDYLKDGEVQLVTSNPSAVRYNGSLGYKAGMTGEKDHLKYYAAEAAERNGETYLACVIGSPDEDHASARAFELLEYAFSAYETVYPDLPDDLPHEIAVKNGRSESVRIRASEIRKMVIPKGTSDRITARTACPEFVYAPVKKNDRIGQVLFYYSDNYSFSADIAAAKNVEQENLSSIMHNMLKNIFSV